MLSPPPNSFVEMPLPWDADDPDQKMLPMFWQLYLTEKKEKEMGLRDGMSSEISPAYIQLFEGKGFEWTTARAQALMESLRAKRWGEDTGFL